MPHPIHIDFLPADPAVRRTVAQWHQGEWSHLSARTVEDRIAEFAQHITPEAAQPNAVPLTVLAWIEGRPVGSASLLVHDMDIHPEWSPWLASVFVLPEQRGHGIGSLLCQRIDGEAQRLGVARLYLYTPDRAPFYQRMAWRILEEIDYKGETVTLMDKGL